MARISFKRKKALLDLDRMKVLKLLANIVDNFGYYCGCLNQTEFELFSIELMSDLATLKALDKKVVEYQTNKAKYPVKEFDYIL